MTTFEDIKELLLMIKEDQSTPKSLREKITGMNALIDSQQDAQLKIESLQQQLEDISNDINLPSFVRTQVWGVSSALEQIE